MFQRGFTAVDAALSSSSPDVIDLLTYANEQHREVVHHRSLQLPRRVSVTMNTQRQVVLLLQELVARPIAEWDIDYVKHVVDSASFGMPVRGCGPLVPCGWVGEGDLPASLCACVGSARHIPVRIRCGER